MSTPEGPPGGPPPTPGAPATGAYAAGQDYPPPGYQQAPPPPYPPQGPPPQYGGQGHGGGGPGFGERASHAVDAIGRHVKTPETKEFFKTSEFLVWVLTVVALLIAGAVIGGGVDDDTLRADLVWKLITGISAAYIISRGISKAATRRGYGDAPMDRGGGYGSGM
jgi:hypothetical protein